MRETISKNKKNRTKNFIFGFDGCNEAGKSAPPKNTFRAPTKGRPNYQILGFQLNLEGSYVRKKLKT